MTNIQWWHQFADHRFLLAIPALIAFRIVFPRIFDFFYNRAQARKELKRAQARRAWERRMKEIGLRGKR